MYSFPVILIKTKAFNLQNRLGVAYTDTLLGFKQVSMLSSANCGFNVLVWAYKG